MNDRRRNGLILLLVVGLLAGSLFVIASKPTVLGLDLRGGVELVFQAKPTPQQPQVTQEAVDRSIEILRERVDAYGVSEPEIQRSGEDQISVGLPNVQDAARAQRQIGKTAQMYFYDWEKNVLGPENRPDPTNVAVTGGSNGAGTIGAVPYYDAVIRAAKRPEVKDGNNTQGQQWYLVNDRTKQVVRGPEDTRADLTSESPAPAGSRTVVINPGTIVVRAEPPRKNDGTPVANADRIQRYFVMEDDPALRGTQIGDPKQGTSGGGGQPNVQFEFKDGGQEQWAKTTKEIAIRGAGQLDPQLKNQHFAVVLDNELISVPFIDSTSDPNGIDSPSSEIRGGFTIDSAQELANNLKTGALPLKLEVISSTQVSATLGRQALDQGLVAGAAGLLIVVLFLIVFYRVLGVIASLALLVYAAYFFALIKLIPITLTLPGIAGLILTIGVAADANIVIFERIKEEVRAGRAIPAAIQAGYKKGFSTIVDANVVTIMVAFVLFVLATAGVKGFALTLGVGVIVSMLTAVLATQAILGTMSKSRILRAPSALGAGKPSSGRLRLNFVGASKWFFSMSGVILLVCALAIGANGLNLGIDFESGTRIKTAIAQSATENQVRDVIAASGLGDAKIQRVTEPELGENVFQISVAQLGPAQVAEVEGDLDRAFGGTDNFSSNSIGPTFGQAVADSAIVAIIASLLIISAYIALRFEWKYAVPVLIALMHDLLITAGVYALLGLEVTTATVAALLTVLGFSLYDTIIVFDRIRENVPRMPRAAFSQIVNRSMSEVLARSLATSFCAGLPVLALLIFGGETLQAFAIALFVGTLSGTYSSVFIASPLLNAWKQREPVYRRRIKRIREDNDGIVPPYAPQGGASDVEPDKPKAPSKSLTAPDRPEEISQQEFEELVRQNQEAVAEPVADEPEPAAVAPKPATPPKPRPRPMGGSSTSTSSSSSTAGAPKKKPKKGATKSGRDKRHGRSR